MEGSGPCAHGRSLSGVNAHPYHSLTQHYIRQLLYRKPALPGQHADDTDTDTDTKTGRRRYPKELFGRYRAAATGLMPSPSCLPDTNVTYAQPREAADIAPLTLHVRDLQLLVHASRCGTLFRVPCVSWDRLRAGASVRVRTVVSVTQDVVDVCLALAKATRQPLSEETLLYFLLTWPFAYDARRTVVDVVPRAWWERWLCRRHMFFASDFDFDPPARQLAGWTQIDVVQPRVYNTFTDSTIDQRPRDIREHAPVLSSLQLLMPTQPVTRVTLEELHRLALWWGWIQVHWIAIVYAVSYADLGDLSVRTPASPYDDNDNDNDTRCCDLHAYAWRAPRRNQDQDQDQDVATYFTLFFYIPDPNAWALCPSLDTFTYHHMWTLLRDEQHKRKRNVCAVGATDLWHMRYRRDASWITLEHLDEYLFYTAHDTPADFGRDVSFRIRVPKHRAPP